MEELCGHADAKDLPILVAALRAEAAWLLTFNTRHYDPPQGAIRVAQPGTFIQELRYLLTRMG